MQGLDGAKTVVGVLDTEGDAGAGGAGPGSGGKGVLEAVHGGQGVPAGVVEVADVGAPGIDLAELPDGALLQNEVHEDDGGGDVVGVHGGDVAVAGVELRVEGHIAEAGGVGGWVADKVAGGHGEGRVDGASGRPLVLDGWRGVCVRVLDRPVDGPGTVGEPLEEAGGGLQGEGEGGAVCVRVPFNQLPDAASVVVGNLGVVHVQGLVLDRAAGADLGAAVVLRRDVEDKHGHVETPVAKAGVVLADLAVQERHVAVAGEVRLPQLPEQLLHHDAGVALVAVLLDGVDRAEDGGAGVDKPPGPLDPAVPDEDLTRRLDHARGGVLEHEVDGAVALLRLLSVDRHVRRPVVDVVPVLVLLQRQRGAPELVVVGLAQQHLLFACGGD